MPDEMPSFFQLLKGLVRMQLRTIGLDDLKVLLVLLQHRNSVTGTAFPSILTIAKLTFGADQRSRVRRSLKRLESKKLIHRRYDGGGRGERATFQITIPLVLDDGDCVDEKTGSHERQKGVTLEGERGSHEYPNGVKSKPINGVSGLLPNQELKENNESQLKRSEVKRCDGDLFTPSGFDFDCERELLEDMEKVDSPFSKLSDWVSPAAVKKLYRHKKLGRALAAALVETDQVRFDGGMYETRDRTTYLGRCCSTPSSTLEKSARLIRRDWQKTKPRPRKQILDDDAPFKTRATKKRKSIPVYLPGTEIVDRWQTKEVDDDSESLAESIDPPGTFSDEHGD